MRIQLVRCGYGNVVEHHIIHIIRMYTIVGKGVAGTRRLPGGRCGAVILLPQAVLLTGTVITALSAQLQHCNSQLQCHTTMDLGMLVGYGVQWFLVVIFENYRLLVVG